MQYFLSRAHPGSMISTDRFGTEQKRTKINKIILRGLTKIISKGAVGKDEILEFNEG